MFELNNRYKIIYINIQDHDSKKSSTKTIISIVSSKPCHYPDNGYDNNQLAFSWYRKKNKWFIFGSVAPDM